MKSVEMNGFCSFFWTSFWKIVALPGMVRQHMLGFNENCWLMALSEYTTCQKIELHSFLLAREGICIQKEQSRIGQLLEQFLGQFAQAVCSPKENNTKPENFGNNGGKKGFSDVVYLSLGHSQSPISLLQIAF